MTRLSCAARSSFARLRSWLRAATHRRTLELEMDAELRTHLELLTEDLIRAGHTPEQAARSARLEMGATLTHKENMRAALGLRLYEEVIADLRYGVRLLTKMPGFTAVAVFSLALAIGANTTIFSVAKALLYNRLEVPRPSELRMLRWNGNGKEAIHSIWGDFDSFPGGGTTSTSISYPVYLQLSAHNTVMQPLAAYKEDGMNATIRGTAQRVVAAMVSGNFYGTLEVQPQLGRAIDATDDAHSGDGTVAVISDALWARDYARSPSAIGQTITLNQSVMTIVGVNPPRFTGAKNVLLSPDIFVPLSMEPLLVPQREKTSNLVDPNFWWVNVVGRLQPGFSESQAHAAMSMEFDAAMRATMHIQQGESIPALVLEDGSRGLHWADAMFKKPVYVLWSFTGLVWLLACANLANLLLSRAAQRHREMSIRLALGAGRRRILRQLLTESVLLAALAGTAGLLLGYLSRNVLPTMFSDSWESQSIAIPFDWNAFAFTSTLTLVAGILFGLAPAWFASRTEVSTSLKESAQTSTRRRRGFSGKSIVAFQIMLSTLLVVGAGLFLRTVTQLNAIDPGFEMHNLVLFDVNPPAARYPPGKDVQLHQELEKRIAALPGVKSVTPASLAYIANSMTNADFLPEGEVFSKGKKSAEFFNFVGSGFFSTLKIPVLVGRGFGSQDTKASPKVAVINQALARKRFPGVNPIGKWFRMDRDPKAPLIQIVGVCANTRYASLKEDPPAQFFMPYVQQNELGGMTYELRTTLSTEALAPALRQVVQSVDRDLPIVDLRTQQEQAVATMRTERTLATLMAGFGLLALSLAAVGIYGVMSYSVSQRTNEIGIRLALGARPGQVRAMVLRESTWIAVTGIAIGLAGAFALTRLIRSMLYGVKPNDTWTLVGGITVLLLVALGSSWIPAWRAANVQPMDALRHE